MGINLNEPLKFTDGYKHRLLSDSMIENCYEVLRAFFHYDRVSTKDGIRRYTGLSHATIGTVIHILRNGVLPNYNITIVWDNSNAVYILTDDPKKIQEYSFSSLTQTLARLKTEKNITIVEVAVNKGSRDSVAKAARALLRKLESIIIELEAYQLEYMEEYRARSENDKEFKE